MNDRQALKIYTHAINDRPIRPITRLRAARKLYKGSASVALQRFNESVETVQQWGEE